MKLSMEYIKKQLEECDSAQPPTEYAARLAFKEVAELRALVAHLQAQIAFRDVPTGYWHEGVYVGDCEAELRDFADCMYEGQEIEFTPFRAMPPVRYRVHVIEGRANLEPIVTEPAP